jgi:hypothetical protein
MVRGMEHAVLEVGWRPQWGDRSERQRQEISGGGEIVGQAPALRARR